MGRITENLLRRRAEHNDGQLASLRELSLEGQSIERIDLIAQRCPRLEILHLQNNIIARIEGLHRLKVAPNAAALPLPGCLSAAPRAAEPPEPLLLAGLARAQSGDQQPHPSRQPTPLRVAAQLGPHPKLHRQQRAAQPGVAGRQLPPAAADAARKSVLRVAWLQELRGVPAAAAGQAGRPHLRAASYWSLSLKAARTHPARDAPNAGRPAHPAIRTDRCSAAAPLPDQRARGRGSPRPARRGRRGTTAASL